MVRGHIPNWLVNYIKHLPLAVLANVVNYFPSRGMICVGVTGTDGKTTTVNMIYFILKSAGFNAGMVSTVGAALGGKEYDTGFHVTSPNAFGLQKYILLARRAGVRVLILEVTSHALDQFRVWGVNFDIGVITNITHEHLDYHKSFENYFLAKAKLVKGAGLSVLNRGEDHFGRLAKLAGGRVVSFGVSKEADFNPRKFPVSLKILGEFNVLNAEAAAAVCVNLGVSKEKVKEYLGNFEGVEGRIFEVENRKGVRVFVDFAHTPNGLDQATKVLRKVTKGRLIAVFGSAGFRDVAKRAMMGEVAAKNCDYIVVTAEDPRGQLEVINKQILEGVGRVKGFDLGNVAVVDDRAEAIEYAIKQVASVGDVVGIFGKGHEKSMNLDGKVETPWSDEEVAKRVLR